MRGEREREREIYGFVNYGLSSLYPNLYSMVGVCRVGSENFDTMGELKKGPRVVKQVSTKIDFNF